MTIMRGVLGWEGLEVCWSVVLRLLLFVLFFLWGVLPIFRVFIVTLVSLFALDLLVVFTHYFWMGVRTILFRTLRVFVEVTLYFRCLSFCSISVLFY